MNTVCACTIFLEYAPYITCYYCGTSTHLRCLNSPQATEAIRRKWVSAPIYGMYLWSMQDLWIIPIWWTASRGPRRIRSWSHFNALGDFRPWKKCLKSLKAMSESNCLAILTGTYHKLVSLRITSVPVLLKAPTFTHRPKDIELLGTNLTQERVAQNLFNNTKFSKESVSRKNAITRSVTKEHVIWYTDSKGFQALNRSETVKQINKCLTTGVARLKPTRKSLHEKRTTQTRRKLLSTTE